MREVKTHGTTGYRYGCRCHVCADAVRAAARDAYARKVGRPVNGWQRRHASAEERTRFHNRKNRAWRMAAVGEIKLRTGCVDCGYRRCVQALEFDHLPSAEKSFSVSNAVVQNTPWKLVLAEIAKCEVVCANCHRERTVARRGT